MCNLLSLSRSGYHVWRRRPASARSIGNAELVGEIQRIYREGRGEYGSPTICHVLRESGHRVNHKRVARLMRTNGLRAIFKPRF